MKTTSESYQEGMAASFRRRSHLRISFEISGTTYTFEDDIIMSASRSADVDPLSRKLPTESFDFSIIDFDGEYNPTNPSGKWAAIDENAEITVEFGLELAGGTTEWLDPDVYLLTGRPTVSGGVATFEATSRLRHLQNKYYKGVAGSHTLLELAEDVLQDSGISSSGYALDASLGSLTTEVPLPIDEAQNLLQMIAHAACCALYTVGDVITIAPIDVTSLSYNTMPFTLRDIANNGDAISKIEPLYKIKAYKYTYNTAADADTLVNSTVDVDGSVEYHCEFAAADNVTVSITAGATITNLQVYASAIDCTITGSGTFIITVTGYPISESSDTVEALESLNTDGGVDTENNKLITSNTVRSALIYAVANYLALRVTHTISYRGSPEVEAMDGLYFATQQSAFATGLVLRNTINYTGALSGQMIIKSISENDSSNAQLYDSDNEEIEDNTGNAIMVIGTEDYHSDYTGDDMDDFIEDVLGV